MNYNIIIKIDDGSEITLPVHYVNEYELKRDVVNLGTNGVIQKNDKDYDYIPPHRILNIKVKEDGTNR